MKCIEMSAIRRCIQASLAEVDLFREPVIGAQDATHPAFADISEQIHGHLTPLELWRDECGSVPESLTVISYSAPFVQEIVAASAEATDLPPLGWFEAKDRCGTQFKVVNDRLSVLLRDKGVRILVAEEAQAYGVKTNPDGTSSPTWSQRHVARVCGLGSFGLHGALITPQGSTHRLGSVLIDATVDEFGTVMDDPFANCLWLQNKTCGVCAKRCPAGAIHLDGQQRDIARCRARAYENNGNISKEKLGKFIGACGLCNTAVPCSMKSPV